MGEFTPVQTFCRSVPSWPWLTRASQNGKRISRHNCGWKVLGAIHQLPIIEEVWRIERRALLFWCSTQWAFSCLWFSPEDWQISSPDGLKAWPYADPNKETVYYHTIAHHKFTSKDFIFSYFINIVSFCFVAKNMLFFSGVWFPWVICKTTPACLMVSNKRHGLHSPIFHLWSEM